MLIKAFTNGSSISFRKKVKLRIWLSFLIALLGFATIGIFVLANIVDFASIGKTEHMRGFLDGFYTGMGGGLIGAGIVTAVKNIRLLKNPEKFKIAEIAESDERERFIIHKTFTAAAFITFVLLLVSTIIAGLYNPTVFVTLLCAFGAFVFVLMLSYIVIRKTH